jgi:hypothetical protein
MKFSLFHYVTKKGFIMTQMKCILFYISFIFSCFTCYTFVDPSDYLPRLANFMMATISLFFYLLGLLIVFLSGYFMDINSDIFFKNVIFISGLFIPFWIIIVLCSFFF